MSRAVKSQTYFIGRYSQDEALLRIQDLDKFQIFFLSATDVVTSIVIKHVACIITLYPGDKKKYRKYVPTMLP